MADPGRSSLNIAFPQLVYVKPNGPHGNVLGVALTSYSICTIHHNVPLPGKCVTTWDAHPTQLYKMSINGLFPLVEPEAVLRERHTGLLCWQHDLRGNNSPCGFGPLPIFD